LKEERKIENSLIPLKREPSPSAASFDNNDSGEEDSKGASPDRKNPPVPSPAPVAEVKKTEIKPNASQQVKQVKSPKPNPVV
jgi:hypothetical protein